MAQDIGPSTGQCTNVAGNHHTQHNAYLNSFFLLYCHLHSPFSLLFFQFLPYPCQVQDTYLSSTRFCAFHSFLQSCSLAQRSSHCLSSFSQGRRLRLRSRCRCR